MLIAATDDRVVLMVAAFPLPEVESGVVYFSSMANRPTLNVLDERLTTSITLGKWFIGLFLSSLLGMGWYLLNRVNDHGEKLAAMQATLNGIAQEQKKAVPTTVGELLKNPNEGTLQAATVILNSARQKKRISDPTLLAQESVKLGNVAPRFQQTPEYWQAATSLISYRSDQSAAKPPSPLPQCADHPRSSTYAENVIGSPVPQTFLVNPPEYLYCEITLDSAAATALYALAIPMTIKFRNCKIIYTGGPIEIPIRPLIKNDKVFALVFTDCQFDMANATTPPATGRALISELLSAPNLSRATLTI